MSHQSRTTGLPRRAVLVTGAAAALGAALPRPAARAAAGSSAAPRAGTLVLVGGGLKDDNAEIYRAIVQHAGGAAARIGIITAAASTPREDPDAGTPDANNSEANGSYYADLFLRYGAAEARWLPIDMDRIAAADDPAVAARALGMTGFFFGGGDQSRYVTTLMHGDRHTDSAMLAAIRRRLGEGAVVAGTSAGAQIQAGADMVTGGESYEALRDGARPGYFEDASVLGYLPAGGFGLFRHGLLDTHFGARGRQGRAVRLAADTGHPRVFGLDENTALEVTGLGTGDERLRVLGAHGVSVLDLNDARTGTVRGRWAVTGVRWSHLTAGDEYTAAGLRPAAGKAALRPWRRTAPSPSADVFDSPRGDGDGYAMVGMARGLTESTRSRSVQGRTLERDPRFAVRLSKSLNTRAYSADDRTADSFADVEVDMHAL